MTVSEIRSNGVSLYYEEHGTGDAILCIHGLGSSASLWGEAVPVLARHGRVVIYDRRGCGRSQHPKSYETTSVTEQADDAAGLVQALRAAPAVIIGRSSGAEIAVDLVRRYPHLVRALVLLEPAIPTLSAQTFAWFDRLASDFRVAAATHELSIATERLFRSLLGDASWDGLPDDTRNVFLDNSPAILAELNGEWPKPDAAAMAGVTRPVLIVSAESSPTEFRAADDALADMIPGARHEVTSGGHLINPASPVVMDFLQEVLTAG